MTKIAEAFVEVSARTNKLERGVDTSLRKSRRKLESFQRFADGWARSLGGVFAGVAGAQGLGALVRMSDKAAESAKRFNTLMGVSADKTRLLADELARLGGYTLVQQMDSISDFQTFFRGLGMSEREAARLSTRVQRLVTDFAAFNDVSLEESANRFISALSGSTEVLDRYGINLRTAALDQQLLAKGMKTVAQGASEVEKAIARIDISESSLANQGAIGAAKREEFSFGALTRRFGSTLSDAVTGLGSVATESEQLRGSLVLANKQLSDTFAGLRAIFNPPMEREQITRQEAARRRAGGGFQLDLEDSMAPTDVPRAPRRVAPKVPIDNYRRGIERMLDVRGDHFRKAIEGMLDARDSEILPNTNPMRGRLTSITAMFERIAQSSGPFESLGRDGFSINSAIQTAAGSFQTGSQIKQEETQRRTLDEIVEGVSLLRLIEGKVGNETAAFT